MRIQPASSCRTCCAIAFHFNKSEMRLAFTWRVIRIVLLSLISLLSGLTLWNFLKPPILSKTILPITGISRVTSSSMDCLIRMHSEVRKYAPKLHLIIGVEFDFIGDLDEYTTLQRLPINISNSAARNLLVDMSTTPLIFAIDETVSFDTDFVPALRLFSNFILRGEYDMIGGCIRTVASDCSSYLYNFHQASSSTAFSSIRTLQIESIDLSFSTNVIKADAVDGLFLASKATLQSIRFDPQIQSGETIDFFLRSLMILRVGGSGLLSAIRVSECRIKDNVLSGSHYMGALFHKWAFKKIVGPFDQMTTLTCSDGQLDLLPESLQFCQVHSRQDFISSSHVVLDPFPPFYSRILKTESFSKIGIVVAATGKYSKFLSPFIASFRTHFLPKSNKIFFVFANSWFAEHLDNDVVVFSQHSLGWPYNSLYRFRMALAMIDNMNVDYLYMADVDLQVVSEIDERIISELVATIAPFSWGLPSVAFPFDRHPASPAYMHPSEGARFYFAGGFFGGSKNSVRSLLHICAKMADTMLAMRPAYVAPWHDESILNRYFHKVRKPTLIAGPEFLYPDPPYDKYMLTFEQQKYSQHILPLMYNLGVRKADADKGIREPDPAVLRDISLSVIKRTHPVKPFSCSAITNSMSSLLCGMFTLTAGSFLKAIDHCSGIGMQLCSSKQLDSLAKAGYCNCGRTWAADGYVLQPRPYISECKQCIKCGQFRVVSAVYCSSIEYESTTMAKDVQGIVCCRTISSDELVTVFSAI